MSGKYITGVVAQVAHGAGLKAATAAPESHVAVPTETVNKALELASRLQGSKDAVKAQQDAKDRKKTPVPARQRYQSPAQLARKEIAKKEGKKRGKRLVLIPAAAFGRDTLGSDALSALRNKLSVL